MGISLLRVDVMMSVPGLNFEQAWKNRDIEIIDGVEMIFISKQDLILTKRTARRAQDLLDLKSLVQEI